MAEKTLEEKIKFAEETSEMMSDTPILDEVIQTFYTNISNYLVPWAPTSAIELGITSIVNAAAQSALALARGENIEDYRLNDHEHEIFLQEQQQHLDERAEEAKDITRVELRPRPIE